MEQWKGGALKVSSNQGPWATSTKGYSYTATLGGAQAAHQRCAGGEEGPEAPLPATRGQPASVQGWTVGGSVCGGGIAQRWSMGGSVGGGGAHARQARDDLWAVVLPGLRHCLGAGVELHPHLAVHLQVAQEGAAPACTGGEGGNG